MATFLLVHGAWHGGWCWRDVAPLLRQAGHAVYTPTLTGLGERAHLATPQTDLATHIEDVVKVLEYEELAAVVLVGHSYGGLVVTGVADRLPDRLAHLVYLDAFVPGDGQAVLDLIAPREAAHLRARVQAEGEGWRLPPSPGASYGVTDAADAAWVASKLVAQPFATFAQPVHLERPGLPVAGTYILCVPSGGLFGGFAARLRQEPGWRSREPHTGHDAMVTQPRALTDLRLEAVAGSP